MKFPEKYRKTVAGVLMATLLLIVAPTSGFASSEVIPPGDAQAQTGMTYGEWSRAWWHYVLEIPFENNPIYDETGANCNFGQSGAVFFLVATDGGNAVRNECRVPAGKILFFPLLGVANLRWEGTDRKSEQGLRASIKGFSESTRVLQANIDGEDVDISLDPDTTPLRTLSPAGLFTIIAPENNILGVVPGQSFDTVTDGFYLMLAPLPPGPHTITFGGTSRYFSSYVTYNLIVEEP